MRKRHPCTEKPQKQRLDHFAFAVITKERRWPW